MRQLALHFFGIPRVELDGAPVTIHRLKAVALLAYLASTRQFHSRDVLATFFWQDSDPVHAHDNLRNCVAELQRSLAGDWLVADRMYLALSTNQVLWVDVHHFRDLLATCTTHNHPASAVCPDCLPTLHEAATLYTADFLCGFSLPDSPAFEEWQRMEAENLRQELASVLDRLVQGHAAQHEHAVALAFAQRRLALDRLHEPAYRTLMELHAANGNRANALLIYAECAAHLHRELGLAPDVMTQQLRVQLLGAAS